MSVGQAEDPQLFTYKTVQIWITTKKNLNKNAARSEQERANASKRTKTIPGTNQRDFFE